MVKKSDERILDEGPSPGRFDHLHIEEYREQLNLFYQYKKDRECYPDPDEEKWRWSWLHRSLMTRTIHMLRAYWCI